MNRIKVETQNTELKPSPKLVLNKKVGTKVIGVIQGRFESKFFPGTFSTLIAVQETDGSTTLYDKAKKADVEVDINQGDTVFLKENTVLAKALSKLLPGDTVEITYMGLGKAKRGRKAPYVYDVFKLEEN